MNGTEKQVKWAEDIRQSIHDDVTKLLTENPDSRRAIMARDVVLPIIDKINDAKWFIENRNFDIMTVSKLNGGQPDIQYYRLIELIKLVGELKA